MSELQATQAPDDKLTKNPTSLESESGSRPLPTANIQATIVEPQKKEPFTIDHVPVNPIEIFKIEEKSPRILRMVQHAPRIVSTEKTIIDTAITRTPIPNIHPRINNGDMLLPVVYSPNYTETRTLAPQIVREYQSPNPQTRVVYQSSFNQTLPTTSYQMGPQSPSQPITRVINNPEFQRSSPDSRVIIRQESPQYQRIASPEPRPTLTESSVYYPSPSPRSPSPPGSPRRLKASISPVQVEKRYLDINKSYEQNNLHKSLLHGQEIEPLMPPKVVVSQFEVERPFPPKNSPPIQKKEPKPATQEDNSPKKTIVLDTTERYSNFREQREILIPHMDHFFSEYSSFKFPLPFEFHKIDVDADHNNVYLSGPCGVARLVTHEGGIHLDKPSTENGRKNLGYGVQIKVSNGPAGTVITQKYKENSLVLLSSSLNLLHELPGVPDQTESRNL